MRTKDIHQLKKSHVSYNSEGFSLYSIDQTNRCHELFLTHDEALWVHKQLSDFFKYEASQLANVNPRIK